MISRRKLLMGACAAAGASLLPRRLRAGTPDDPTFATASATPMKVLEIFLYGGLSPWESFYFEPTGITGLYDGGTLRTRYNNVSVNTPPCSSVALPALPSTVLRGPGDRHFEFSGRPFKWAKGTRPLVARPDMMARTKVVTMTSAFDAHPLGIPQAITGRRFGDARAASVGAAVQRRHLSDGPVSFVIVPPENRFSPGDQRNFDAFFATGAYPASARPIRLSLGDGNELATWAQRESASAPGDRLSAHYRDRYRAGLSGARSREFTSYSAVVDGLGFAPRLVDRYSLIEPVGGMLAHCSPLDTPSTLPSGPNTTRDSLQLAKKLFARGAKYVGMIDTGRGRDTLAAYDGHGDTAGVTTGNLYNLLFELTAVVRGGGVSDPEAFSLDDTLIVLNTEMGRASGVQGDHGRNHWGRGYVAVLIGGPLRPSDGAPMLAGSFSSMGDNLVGTFTPAQLLSNVLRAAGIEPAHPTNFVVPGERDYTILP